MKTLLCLITVLSALLPAARAQSTIQSGRAIEIRILGVPNEEMARINSTYPVSSSGLIRMPYIGDIQAAGMTSSGLASRIESAYKAAEIYTNPTIQVIVSSDDTVAENVVTVGGQVQSPGPVKFQPGMTLYQAVQAARGATPFGSMYRVKLIRNGKLREYDLTKTQFKGILVQPNDTVEVPQKNLWGR